MYKTKSGFKNLYLPVFILFMGIGVQALISCSSGGGDNGQSGSKITKSKISGVSQKGPFVEGSTATLYELNEEFVQTGRSFRDIIANDKGSFEIKGVELISPYAMLEASGYYRNEVTGQVSKGTITLFAIADVREKDNINVNLLTHLEYYRVLNLAENGKSVAEAKKQAQKEILAVFGISGDFKNSEDMSIFGATEGDAALLAISVLLQGNLGEGEFSQRLTNFAQSLKESGKWENETAKTAIADWALRDLEGIRNNIVGWGLSSEVPDFEKYVTNYGATNHGLGACNSSNEGEVKAESRSGKECICENKFWRIATDFERDTYQWAVCSASNEGEMKASKSGTEYICENKVWRAATNFERDTYQWAVCSASNEGEIKAGRVSNKEYICKNGDWREPSYKDKYCLENDCEYFVDTRDEQRYFYVVIGEQTWMAENLNYNPGTGNSACTSYTGNCTAYGRLYDWSTAMNLASNCNSSSCSSQIQTKHRGICPAGWHIPSEAEWDALMTAVGGSSTAETKLKAKSGWSKDDNGTDEFGFSALPGGYGQFGSTGGMFGGVGNGGYWWSVTEISASYAYYQSIYYMAYYCDNAGGCNYGKSFSFSVRCVKD